MKKGGCWVVEVPGQRLVVPWFKPSQRLISGFVEEPGCVAPEGSTKGSLAVRIAWDPPGELPEGGVR
jgi:hypothetical protein